jgi:hypothetical protein
MFNTHLSSGDGEIGQLVADVQSLTPLDESHKKKKTTTVQSEYLVQ